MDSAHKETALSCGEAHAGDALDKPARGTIIAYMADQTRIPQEVEAKLLAPRAATLSAIAQLKNLGLYRLRPRQTVRLHTVYLDTAAFTLARQGVALRLRRNRTRWEASIKWSGREDGLVAVRPELTVLLSRAPSFPFTLPPGRLAAHLSALVAEQPLMSILVSDVRRQRFAVRAAGQATAPAFAELALDRVRLSAPGAHGRSAATYCEVEIELETRGMEPEMRAFAALLRERFALLPAEGSKFSRGLALLYGPGLIGAVRHRPAARKKASPPAATQ